MQLRFWIVAVTTANALVIEIDSRYATLDGNRIVDPRPRIVKVHDDDTSINSPSSSSSSPPNAHILERRASQELYTVTLSSVNGKSNVYAGTFMTTTTTEPSSSSSNSATLQTETSTVSSIDTSQKELDVAMALGAIIVVKAGLDQVLDGGFKLSPYLSIESTTSPFSTEPTVATITTSSSQRSTITRTLTSTILKTISTSGDIVSSQDTLTSYANPVSHASGVVKLAIMAEVSSMTSTLMQSETLATLESSGGTVKVQGSVMFALITTITVIFVVLLSG
ncbi:uncharacterized protein SAPINGB_P001579 [Magnusiomyces paraingens]|uniref:Uncharacterized protein n=1 Tax=Magnusiomyces paraingens TaxID=2606893 RepID=A0A5E8B727_9ASCO|nr:uncharacterized protein SAPINGB_P001579 [Saprochaete ingens]VVT47173.1 unnamed protein product [Saprochaete ingens]